MTVENAGNTEPDAPRASIGARRNPDTEAAVLDAAAAIIAEEGFAKLTMESVARRARSGKATLYRWWPSRGHLLLALYTRAKSEMQLADTGTLRGDLEFFVNQLIRRWQGDAQTPAVGPLFRLLVAESQMDAEVRAAMRAEREQRWHHLDQIMARARGRGELAPDLSDNAAGQRVISQMWYLLLTDALPPPEAAKALVQDMLGPMQAD
jgi:AcrR family transcriptional regulator